MNAYRQWIEVATQPSDKGSQPFELSVDGLCPLVRKIASGDKFTTCEELESNLPGLVNGMSKVNWKKWQSPLVQGLFAYVHRFRFKFEMSLKRQLYPSCNFLKELDYL